MLKIAGRRVVVVGAGEVGRRRAAAAAQAGAKVTIIDACPSTGGSAPGGLPDGIEVIADAYDPAMLRGAAIVFACTGDRAVNARIVADARSAGALANAADQPENCDFFMPAVSAEGDVVVAVGTGGAAPGLSRWLVGRLAEGLPDRIGEFAAALAKARAMLREAGLSPRRRMDATLRRQDAPGVSAPRRAGGDGDGEANSGQWTVDSGQLTAVSGPTVDS